MADEPTLGTWHERLLELEPNAPQELWDMWNAWDADEDALRARIAELEAALNDSENRRVLASLERDDTLAEATARIAELEAALRWYADSANYEVRNRHLGAQCAVEADAGDRARRALGES